MMARIGYFMPFLPQFCCSNTDCRLYNGGILLPYSNPPKTKPDPKPWPTDSWRALFLCPECKQVRTCKKEDIVWRESTDEDYAAYLEHAAWFLAEFVCGESGCETPVELHVLDDGGRSIQAVESILRSGTVGGLLACGHSFLPPAKEKLRIRREPQDQPIRSYSH